MTGTGIIDHRKRSRDISTTASPARCDVGYLATTLPRSTSRLLRGSWGPTKTFVVKKILGVFAI